MIFDDVHIALLEKKAEAPDREQLEARYREMVKEAPLLAEAAANELPAAPVEAPAEAAGGLAADGTEEPLATEAAGSAAESADEEAGATEEEAPDEEADEADGAAAEGIDEEEAPDEEADEAGAAAAESADEEEAPDEEADAEPAGEEDEEPEPGAGDTVEDVAITRLVDDGDEDVLGALSEPPDEEDDIDETGPMSQPPEIFEEEGMDEPVALDSTEELPVIDPNSEQEPLSEEELDQAIKDAIERPLPVESE